LNHAGLVLPWQYLSPVLLSDYVSFGKCLEFIELFQSTYQKKKPDSKILVIDIARADSILHVLIFAELHF
jgi:hypothetical protein